MLDDMDLHEDSRLQGHFVWIDPEFGLCADHVAQAVETLCPTQTQT